MSASVTANSFEFKLEEMFAEKEDRKFLSIHMGLVASI